MARWHRTGDDVAPSGPAPERPAEASSGGATDDTAPLPPPTPASQVTPTPAAAPGPPPPPAPVAPPPIAPWAPPPGAYALTPAGAAGLQYGRTLDRAIAYLLDGLIIGIPTVILVAFIGTWAAAGGPMRLGGVGLVATIITVGANLLYFVAFWTGGDGATPGMRLMKLRIADARNGQVLTVQQGLVRWLALGGVFQLLAILPPIAPIASLLELVWLVVLLATTATSPTKQGLHDRFANSALVQPLNVQTPAVTCLVIFVLLFVLVVVGGTLAALYTVSVATPH